MAESSEFTGELEALRVLAVAERPLRAVEIAQRGRLNRSSVRVYLLRLARAGLVQYRGDRTLRALAVTKRGAERAFPRPRALDSVRRRRRA